MPAGSTRWRPRASSTRRRPRAGSPSSSATSICSRDEVEPRRDRRRAVAIATRDAGTIYVAEPRKPLTKSVVSVAIRPEKVKLSRRAPAVRCGDPRAINRLEGVITDVSYLGGLTTYKVKLEFRRGGALVDGQHHADRSMPTARPARGGLVHARRLPGAGTMSARRIFARPARFAAIAPYVWMVLFFLVPFGFVLKIALSQTAIAQPPYTPVFDFWDGREATQGCARAIVVRQFQAAGLGQSLHPVLSAQPDRRAGLDRDPAPDRLSHRLWHGAAAAALAGALR